MIKAGEHVRWICIFTEVNVLNPSWWHEMTLNGADRHQPSGGVDQDFQPVLVTYVHGVDDERNERSFERGGVMDKAVVFVQASIDEPEHVVRH